MNLLPGMLYVSGCLRKTLLQCQTHSDCELTMGEITTVQSIEMPCGVDTTHICHLRSKHKKITSTYIHIIWGVQRQTADGLDQIYCIVHTVHVLASFTAFAVVLLR